MFGSALLPAFLVGLARFCLAASAFGVSFLVSPVAGLVGALVVLARLCLTARISGGVGPLQLSCLTLIGLPLSARISCLCGAFISFVLVGFVVRSREIVFPVCC